MFTVLFLNTRTNELLNYENAIESEKKHVAENYSFEEWLYEKYTIAEVYHFFIDQGDVNQAKDELQKQYQEEVQEIAEYNLDRPAEYDWKVYTVDI